MTERQRFPRTFDAPTMHRGKMFRHRWILIVGWALMLFGCAAPETIDVTSFDPAQDQLAIAGYYRGDAPEGRLELSSLYGLSKWSLL